MSSTALIEAAQQALPVPTFNGAEMVRALAAYRELQAALDKQMPDAIQKIGDRHFRKKGYWRAIATAFALNVECVSEEPYEHDDGEWGYRVRYRARTKSGRVVDGDGACSSAEKKGTQATEHNVRSHAHCVPLRAAILTRRGFRQWDEIEIGDEVLAYDGERDLCVWTPLRAVSVFEDQPVLRLASKSFLAYCTADHSWAIRGERTREREEYRRLVKTCDLHEHARAMSNAIVVAAPAASGDHPLSPDDAAILGWLITDGSLRRPYGDNSSFWRAHIDQSKPQYVDELRELVGAHATESITPAKTRTFPTGNTSPTRQSHRFALRAAKLRDILESAGIESRADVPLLVPRLSQPARAAMLDAMLKADGHQRWSASNDATWVFANTDDDVFTTFQLLATLEGRALGRFTREGPRQSRAGTINLQTLRSARHAQLRALVIEDAGQDDVWCPTTDLGTWLMRLDGNVTITGNTRAFNRAVSNACGFGEVSAEELVHEATERPRPSRPARRETVNVQTGEIVEAPRADATPEPAEAHITREQFDELLALAVTSGWKEDEFKSWLKKEGYASAKAIPASQYAGLKERAEMGAEFK